MLKFEEGILFFYFDLCVVYWYMYREYGLTGGEGKGCGGVRRRIFGCLTAIT